MSATLSHPPRAVSPVDHDLQVLYDEVWAGFAAEDGLSPEKDLDGIYNVYGSDSDYVSPSPVTPSSAVSGGSGNRIQSTYGHDALPANGRSSVNIRRLPPTPGHSSSSPTKPPSISMPEPEIYHDSRSSSPGVRPSHVNSESYSSGSSLLRKATAGSVSSVNNANSRRLPAPPGPAGPGSRPSGLPSSPSPRNRPPTSPSSINSSGASPSLSRESLNRVPSVHRVSESVDYPTTYQRSPGGHAPQLSLSSEYLSPQRYDDHYSSTSSLNSSPSTYSYKNNRGAQFDSASPSDFYISPSMPSIYRGDSAGSYSNGVNAQGQPVRSQQVPYPYPVQRMPEPEPVVVDYSDQLYAYEDSSLSNGASNIVRRPTDMLRDIRNYRHSNENYNRDMNGYEENGEWESVPGLSDRPRERGDYTWEWEYDDDGEESFVNFSLLSHLAVQLKDKVPRGTHVKGSIPYPRAFTGKDIVTTIQQLIQRELALEHRFPASDRRAALQVARSLQSQLFFYEVEWGGRVLQDGVEDVYMFLDDPEGAGPSGMASTSSVLPTSPSGMDVYREELPTGVVTMLTRCYVPTCVDEDPCYAFDCPKRGHSLLAAVGGGEPEAPAPLSPNKTWPETVPKEVLETLPESEINRQTIIHKIIHKEDQYIQDLDIVESVFIRPLRNSNPPAISPPAALEKFIDDVFGNILDLRECNKRLLEILYVRQREQQYVIQRIGDIFLNAAADFRLVYPVYIGLHPLAEKRMKDEIEANPEFRLFLEHASRQQSRNGQNPDAPRWDLKHFLNRPSEHLQKYPVLLEAILRETAVGNPDAEYLKAAIGAIKDLQTFAQLRTFQTAMGKGVPGKWEWHDLVSPEFRKTLTKEEAKRQNIIFELIKGEMAYVKDLENIETMYIQPLREADPPIIPPERLDQFIKEVFNNFDELYAHHYRLVEKFHAIQREQHPTIRSVTAAMFDAALNFRDAYMEYIPNYPIAAYRIDDEMANNPAFKAFVEKCVRHPDAHRLDMKNFINRPIPRLLRYELLLKGILDETPPGHDDRKEIPQVLEVIKSLGKETEPGVEDAKRKVQLWKYNSHLVFKPGEWIDMDLLDKSRQLIHEGKLLRQPEGGIEWSGMSELFVLLFDNYLVLTKPKERDGLTKYHVNRRPIPLDLLTLVNFTDPPAQRGTGLLRGLRPERHAADPSGNSASATSPESDSRLIYPLALHHSGREGGPYLLYAESAQARSEWKQKLEEALTIRKVVQESNKVFEMEMLSADTFLIPSVIGATSPPAWSQENSFTGKVTCSVPFNTADGRGLVAVGCAEGVWIGFRHDPKSMRRVLHLKMVTQCAMLEDFGIFLVLADKSLFAYHIEALVPSSPHSAQTSQIPQKLNGNRDVHFFSVGTLHGRTLVIYMKKKGLDSIFRVLEPVGEKINERSKASASFGSKFFKSARSEWFRVYRDFFLPSESFDLIFLKARIAILCAKGFEIMDLNDFKSVTIPQREDPRLAQLAKRCDTCRPKGMFRSADDEFLLCYDEFGLYVDKHGDPSRAAGTIEWEGTAERVALHSPYILLFDSRFIEVRHLETGRLMQIIPGTDVRCIWDGRGVSANNVLAAPIHDGRDEPVVQEAQVHAVISSSENTTRSRAIIQEVFELVPTVPLYLPEPLPNGNSRNSASYSPQLRTSMSWRS